MAQNSRITDDETAPNTRSKTRVTRRSYVRSLAAVATATTATAAAGSATAEEYETIEIPAGETRTFELDSGETFENVVFDQTATGAAAVIVANGTDWTIRNVGWKGAFADEGRAIACSDEGGNTSRIENVYLGDGVDESVGGQRHPKLGIWVAPQHSGHIDFEHVYVEGAHDNSFYASAPGSGAGGTVHFKNCYSKDSWVSHFRLAEGTVENCVAVNTSEGRDGRPLWVWPNGGSGTAEVVDSDFVAGSYANALDLGRDGGRTEVHLEDTDYAGQTRELGAVTVTEDGDNGSDPDTSVPAGVPESAEAAATGDTGSDERFAWLNWLR